jgi:hypothetical protein
MRTLRPKALIRAAVLGAAALVSFAGMAVAGSSRGAELKQVVYMYSVAEYCGLTGAEVDDAYRREMRELTRRGGLPESTVRWLRIRGMMAADLEYGNRGLGGFRNWCRTDGAEAVRHFLAFRAARSAAERDRAAP